jgi:hypothetical protein
MSNREHNTYQFKNRFLNDLTSNTSTGTNFINIKYKNTFDYAIKKPNIYEYFYKMPNNLNIFGQIEPYVANIEKPNIRSFLIDFMQVFQDVLKNIMGNKQLSNSLPSMKMQEDEDSVFLEWIFKDLRVGFSFENDLEESSWYMITNKNLEEFSISGKLYTKDIYFTITRILNYVLENT